MKRGRLTIPTDKDFVEGTKKLAEYWGADAVRDCDGTELPDCARELAEKVYKTYFPIRDDNEYAYSHYDETGCVALITDRATAVSDRLEINLLDGLFKEQIAVYNADCKKYWQVFDRTAGKEIDTWEYIGNDTVRISGATPMHEYTVNFFGKCLWDPTQIYNYTCNGWTKTKDRDIDPVYPAAFDRSVERLKNWLKENEQVNVVRFTTLFYHFFLLYKTGKTQKLFDWYNYAMAASPAMFRLFKERYGYEITLEDVVNAGDYSNLYVIPSKAYSDYTDLVQKFVSEKAKVLVDEVHKAGREAIMFWGDNWIGAEPYGKYFKDIGFDGVVGSAVSGVNVRIVADIPDIKYREIRLNPYFFPDTLADDDTATERLKRSWTAERRAILGKPVDRIGFGGYLKIAAKFPKFCAAVKDLCDEFREICDAVGGGKAYTFLKVGVLDYWGKEKSWTPFNIAQDAAFLINSPYIGVLEALVGMPVEVEFINFDDVKRGGLEKFDVIMNYGDEGTAFTGGDFWKDPEIVSAVKSFVYNGGGFIGIGEPTSVRYQGKFFQLSDVLGVEEEKGNTALYLRYNTETKREHFILADAEKEIDYAGDRRNIYAKEGATILDAYYDDSLPAGSDNCNVRCAVNSFGKGRSFYMTGMRYNAENTRLLYRALLWTGGKENELYKAFSTNVNTECRYYPESGKYAVASNVGEKTETVFYDVNGKAEKLALAPFEIKWIG